MPQRSSTTTLIKSKIIVKSQGRVISRTVVYVRFCAIYTGSCGKKFDNCTSPQSWQRRDYPMARLWDRRDESKRYQKYVSHKLSANCTHDGGFIEDSSSFAISLSHWCAILFTGLFDDCKIKGSSKTYMYRYYCVLPPGIWHRDDPCPRPLWAVKGHSNH
jgi:hypothetical protein